MSELTDHVAIISGGLGDIGRACAVELARRGADVAVGGRSDGGRLEPLRAEIEMGDGSVSTWSTRRWSTVGYNRSSGIWGCPTW